MRAIVFGSRRISYIAEPLRAVGVEVNEIPSWGKSPLRRIKAAFELYLLCRKFPDSHVIVDTPQWIGLAAAMATKLARKDYVLVLRGDVFREFKNPLASWMNRKIVGRAKGIVFLSNHLKGEIIARMPSIKRFAVIPCAYLLKPADEDYVKRNIRILTVTGFYYYEKVKPLFTAMNAIDRFLAMYPEAAWDICGAGPYLKKAEILLRDLEHRNRIHLHGHCTDVSRFYENASVFLYITGLDVFPLVISEAFLHRLPVVVNKASSMSELVEEGSDGFLVDMGLVDWEKKLFNSLTFLFENPTIALRMGLNGKAKVLERYSPERVGALFVDFISSIGNRGL